MYPLFINNQRPYPRNGLHVINRLAFTGVVLRHWHWLPARQRWHWHTSQFQSQIRQDRSEYAVRVPFFFLFFFHAIEYLERCLRENNGDRKREREREGTNIEGSVMGVRKRKRENCNVFVQRKNNRRRKCAETVNGGQKLFLNGWINERRRYSGSFFFSFFFQRVTLRKKPRVEVVIWYCHLNRRYSSLWELWNFSLFKKETLRW